MLLANLIVIAIVSIICISRIYQVKKKLKDSAMHTHIIIMGVSMITSLTFGIVIGMMFMHDLVTSTIVATSIGLVIGFIVGKPFNNVAILGGMTESVMGAMMGTMTGSMVHMASNYMIFLLFVNVVFAILASCLLWTLYGFYFARKTNRK